MKNQQQFQNLAVVGSTLLLLATAACSKADNNIRDVGGSADGDGIAVEYNGTSFVADATAPAVQSGIGEGSFSARTYTGWVNKDAVTFGSADATLGVIAGSASSVEPGTYSLEHAEFRNPDNQPYASLEFATDGLPELKTRLYSRSGELVLEKLRFVDGKLTQMVYTFSGKFSERPDLPMPSEGADADLPHHDLSGRVQFGGK